MARLNHIARYCLATIGLIFTLAATANAKLSDRYNVKHPIKMGCDMEFAPYEYRNDNGKAAGFNVDVANRVSSELGIPVTYVMKEWNVIINEMKHGKIDLMLVASLEGDLPGLYYSKIVVTPYKVGIAYKQGKKPVSRISDIPKDAKVVFKRDDYGYTAAVKAGIATKKISFDSPKYALYGLDKGAYDYFIYCELPLRWHLRKYNLDNIQVRQLDVPGKQFRFVSKDKQLLTSVDDALARIQQQGDINKIRNKWLNYNGQPKGIEENFLKVIFAIAIIFLVVIIFNRIISQRVKKMLQETIEVNRVLGDALVASHNNVICHKFKTKRIENISGTWLPKMGMSEDDFRAHIHPDDRDNVTFIKSNISNPQEVASSCKYRWNIGSPDKPIWRLMVNNPVPEVDDKGHLVSIVSTIVDITDLKENQKKESEMANRYQQIFDNSLVGFALYNTEGKLAECNQKFKDILHFKTPANKIYYETTNLFDLENIKDSYTGRQIDEYVVFCTRIMLYGTPESQYVEVRIRHIDDEDGNPIYHMLTLTNINEERNNFITSQKGDTKIRAVSKQVQQYENELRYLLESAHMRVWSTSKEDNEARFFKDLRSYEVKMSIEEFIGKVVREEDKDLALKLADATYNKCKPVTGMIKIKNLFNENEGERWYSINSIPNYDGDGTLLGCFGLIRDVTLMIDSQEKLMEETARANESDQQKSAFLANMSHEIRTPLNAIVGFCDLLQAVDDPEEKKEFMRIIRNNCDLLLMLIDDILTLSTIDSSESQLRFKDVDFAPLFDDICMSMSQRVASKPQIEFVKDNPFAHLETCLDKDRLQQVITNFVTNAVKNTEQGHIKVGMSLQDRGIKLYCEDTGCGIPQDKCDKIFQRFVKLNDFVQGAGLGLSICKKIAEMYRGKIGVDSKVGEGSTFWLWVPCEIKNVEYVNAE